MFFFYIFHQQIVMCLFYLLSNLFIISVIFYFILLQGRKLIMGEKGDKDPKKFFFLNTYTIFKSLIIFNFTIVQ